MVKARESFASNRVLRSSESRTGTIARPSGGTVSSAKNKTAVRGGIEERGLLRRDRDVAGRHLVHARLETGRTTDPGHFAAIGPSRCRGYRSTGAGGAWTRAPVPARVAVALLHPNTGKEMEFTSELPEDLGRLSRGRGGPEWRVCQHTVTTRQILHDGLYQLFHCRFRGHACRSPSPPTSRGLCTQPPPRGTGRCPGTPGPGLRRDSNKTKR